ncbi:hypothetical protein QQ054_22925 [Oscillatoria amoena NRMC-F 0135]|nr:hypothetical protein [Oscillatoria amoena NRMC-F 0135]
MIKISFLYDAGLAVYPVKVAMLAQLQPMGPVLCALDFSETSPLVLKTAVDLTMHYQTRLVALYAYRIQPESEAIADYRQTKVKKAHDQFALLESKLGLNGSVPYEFRAEVGFLSDRIESWIKKKPDSFSGARTKSGGGNQRTGRHNAG